MVHINQMKDRRVCEAFLKQIKCSCQLFIDLGKGHAEVEEVKPDFLITGIEVKTVIAGQPHSESFNYTPLDMQKAANYMFRLANVSPSGSSNDKEVTLEDLRA